MVFNSRPARRAWLLTPLTPQGSGSGFQLRVFSNARALADLGFRVEVVSFDQRVPPGPYTAAGLEQVSCANLTVPDQPPSLLGKLAYRMGWVTLSSWAVQHPQAQAAAAEIARLPIDWADDIVVTEGLMLPVAMASAGRAAPVISYHDSTYLGNAATVAVDRDVDGHPPSIAERRAHRFLQREDRWLMAGEPRTWTISATDRDRLRTLPGGDRVQYLPLSAPREDPFCLGQEGPDGDLQLVHLGAPAHLPSFTSLRSLLTEVWPALPDAVRDRVTLNVVGAHDPAYARTRHLLALAAPFPKVRFHGFVEDLASVYLGNHAQIVVSTSAVGARTRVIESLAAGLPVITTPIATDGLEGIEPGAMLNCDGPAAIRDALIALVADRSQLPALAQQGRACYERAFSRDAVGAKMRDVFASWGVELPLRW